MGLSNNITMRSEPSKIPISQEMPLNVKAGAMSTANNVEMTTKLSGSAYTTLKGYLFDGLKVKSHKIGSLASFLFSGEGTIHEFQGDGVIFVGSGEGLAGGKLANTIIKSIADEVLPFAKAYAKHVAVAAMGYFACKSSCATSLLHTFL